MVAMTAIWDFLSQTWYFYLQVTPMLPTNFRVNWPFSSEEEKVKIDFQDGRHLGFLIRTILAILYRQVIPMLPTNFQINWPFDSGK